MASKTNRSSGRSRFRILVLTILLFGGCSPASSMPVPPTPTFSKYLPPTWTASVTVTPTITLTPGKALPPTKTQVPGSTPTIYQTPAPTLTKALSPTRSYNELIRKFEALLATNGGCRLPCFWGLTPGKTTVAELKQFLGQFPTDFASQRGSYTLFYITSKTGDSAWSVTFWTDPEKLTGILLPVETAQHSFPLAKILSDYGTPEKVFIGPPQESEHGLVMVVLYEKQQFAGRYILWQNEQDKTLYCYDPQSIAQYVITWAPDRDWLNWAPGEMKQSKELLKPLDEVSDYDIPSLYAKLKVPNRALCMHVQTDKILP
jgi:hypothetical protein